MRGNVHSVTDRQGRSGSNIFRQPISSSPWKPGADSVNPQKGGNDSPGTHIYTGEGFGIGTIAPVVDGRSYVNHTASEGFRTPLGNVLGCGTHCLSGCFFNIALYLDIQGNQPGDNLEGTDAFGNPIAPDFANDWHGPDENPDEPPLTGSQEIVWENTSPDGFAVENVTPGVSNSQALFKIDGHMPCGTARSISFKMRSTFNPSRKALFSIVLACADCDYVARSPQPPRYYNRSGELGVGGTYRGATTSMISYPVASPGNTLIQDLVLISESKAPYIMESVLADLSSLIRWVVKFQSRQRDGE